MHFYRLVLFVFLLSISPKGEITIVEGLRLYHELPKC